MTYKIDIEIGGRTYPLVCEDADDVMLLLMRLQTIGKPDPVPGVKAGGSGTERESCRDAAEATLRHMGYYWNGGVLWRPPIGKAPVFEVAMPATPLPEIEGWIDWFGGSCPVGADERVDVVLRGGTHLKDIRADTLIWHNTVQGVEKKTVADIVKYRVVSKAEPEWVPWTGGRMPVEAGTRVRYRTRNHYEGVRLAEVIDWGHQSTPRTGDIVAYKVVAPCA